MNYAELKQRKEALKADRASLEAQIAALQAQEREYEQEFLAGLATVKVGDLVLYKGDVYEVVGYSNYMLIVANSFDERGYDPNTPDAVAYALRKVLANGTLAKKEIELTDRDVKALEKAEVEQ